MGTSGNEAPVSPLFSLRSGELFAVLTGVASPEIYPPWVINVGRKLFFDFFPRNTSIPSKEARPYFAWGIMIGFYHLDSEGHLFAEDLMGKVATLKGPLGTIMPVDAQGKARMLREEAGAYGYFTEKHRAEILADFFALDFEKRIAFANGLLLGATTMRDLQAGTFFSSGGSYRREVWLALWLNWPDINEGKTLPAIYAKLERSFDEAGKHDVLGSFDRFKMLARAIELRPRRRKIDRPKAN